MLVMPRSGSLNHVKELHHYNAGSLDLFRSLDSINRFRYGNASRLLEYSYTASRPANVRQLSPNYSWNVRKTYHCAALLKRSFTTDTFLSTLDRHDIEPSSQVSRRTYPKGILWCAKDSRTHVVINIARLIPAEEVFKMLDGVYYLCLNMIRHYGDQPIAGGSFLWVGNNQFELRVRNANNHQTTYGVLGAAMLAVKDYMGRFGYYTGTFTIFDGINHVGDGTIGVPGQ